MFKFLRSHLGLKLFFSYVAVVLIGVLVLALTTNFSAPAAFQRHLAGMNAMMSDSNMMGRNPMVDRDLFTNYSASIREALSLAAIAALAAAVIASYLISRRVVTPVQRMTKLSQRIAEGEYEERLALAKGSNVNQLDELGQLAISFNQMAEKLDKTEAMRRQLIGDVTHELRTPLAAIKGYMEGLIDGVIPAEAPTFQLVHNEIDRLQRLVNDLQELSRVEAGALQLNLTPVSINELVETVKTNLEPQFKEKDIQLKIRLEPDLPEVMADKDRIQQVLTNLAGNALQYTPNGGTVTIRAVRERSDILVSVEDNGIGINADQIPLIFNRFYRTDKSRTRSSGGSGIGLTIAQALVKAHNGRIWVDSEGEGKGSTFTFSLPVSNE